jgi:membrane-bound metal-dependent hydrolase YbcI (DUF457 family)
MGHITLINLFFLFIGVLLHVLIDFVKEKKTNKRFTFSKWFKENQITIIISVIIGFISLYFVDFGLDGLGVYAETDALFYQAHSFVSGFAPYATFAKIFKIEIQEE